jgi:multimeric flavodoxin WrbA
MPIPAATQTIIERQADDAPGDYSDLRALVFNGTLKRSPEPSHTDERLAVARGVLERVGVRVDEIRTVDHEIPPGVWPDMREHGYARDDFPALYRELVAPADIIVVAGPIWLGDQSSLTRTIIERLYAYAGEESYHGKVGGALAARNVSAPILQVLQQIGLAVPPQSDDAVLMTWNLLDLARAA